MIPPNQCWGAIIFLFAFSYLETACCFAVVIFALVIVHSVNPENFRNLAKREIQFSPEGNFIYGRNGQGKTNLLEAIFWLLALSPKRGTTRESIKKGENEFKIKALLTYADLTHDVNLTVSNRSKRLLVDGTPVKRRRDYLKDVLVVDFFPEDLLILIMEPSLRRNFIDTTCAQYSILHDEILKRYRKILEQRNSLLRAEHRPDTRLLASFDDPLADVFSKITFMRLHVLTALAEKTDCLFRQGIGEKHQAAIHYVSSVPEIPSLIPVSDEINSELLKEKYLKAIDQTRRNDIEAGMTTVGPHRDDWQLALDGKPVRSYGSRGEVRSAMFALHVARFHVLADKRQIQPVVLIDDVMSELDSERRVRVLELLPPCQVFLTACDPPPELNSLKINLARFVVENGMVHQTG